VANRSLAAVAETGEAYWKGLLADAQTRLERARENRVTALYAYNIARIDQAAATGTLKELVR